MLTLPHCPALEHSQGQGQRPGPLTDTPPGPWQQVALASPSALLWTGSHARKMDPVSRVFYRKLTPEYPSFCKNQLGRNDRSLSH